MTSEQKRYIVKPNEPPKKGLEMYTHLVWDSEKNETVAYAGPFTSVDWAAQMNEKGFIEP